MLDTWWCPLRVIVNNSTVDTEHANACLSLFAFLHCVLFSLLRIMARLAYPERSQYGGGRNTGEKRWTIEGAGGLTERQLRDSRKRRLILESEEVLRGLGLPGLRCCYWDSAPTPPPLHPPSPIHTSRHFLADCISFCVQKSLRGIQQLLPAVRAEPSPHTSAPWSALGHLPTPGSTFTGRSFGAVLNLEW